MKKTELVFIPAPGAGHSGSMTEFAKSLLARTNHLSITILVINPPSTALSPPPRFTSDEPIRFINIPPVDPPSSLKCPVKFISDYIESHKPQVEQAIMSEILSDKSVQFAGIVIDLLCTSMIDIAHKLNFPSYLFFTSGASFLGFMLYLPIRHAQVAAEFSWSDSEQVVSTYENPLPANVLPPAVFANEGYTSSLYHGSRFKETKGYIINTFFELEPYAINSLMMTPPPVYAVGPIVNHKVKEKSSGSKWDDIKTWLDDQPPLSVVFLCFGSVGSFDTPQVEQIAMALESGETRFLWSIRQPPPKGSHGTPTDYENIQDALPKGFLERIGKRGMMCGWVPQVEVLAHSAVGGFITHCGWNSILESVWYGVPIATWPLYAEQHLNAFLMVEELGLAVELKSDNSLGREEVVMADVIEEAINCLLNVDNPVRKRVKEMSEVSKTALVDGGSSYESLGRLIEHILGDIQEIDA